MQCRNCTVECDDDDTDMCVNCRASGIGSRHLPYTHGLPHDLGLPYRAWCKCNRCGRLAMTTITFDFYQDGPGPCAPLMCEVCALAELFKK